MSESMDTDASHGPLEATEASRISPQSSPSTGHTSSRGKPTTVITVTHVKAKGKNVKCGMCRQTRSHKILETQKRKLIAGDLKMSSSFCFSCWMRKDLPISPPRPNWFQRQNLRSDYSAFKHPSPPPFLSLQTLSDSSSSSGDNRASHSPSADSRQDLAHQLHPRPDSPFQPPRSTNTVSRPRNLQYYPLPLRSIHDSNDAVKSVVARQKHAMKRAKRYRLRLEERNLRRERVLQEWNKRMRISS